MALLFTDHFRQQFLATAEWLELERPGAGIGLRVLVFRSLKLVQMFPEMHAEYEPGIRRILIKKYHQHIYYAVEGEDVVLLDMIDARRRPKGQEDE